MEDVYIDDYVVPFGVGDTIPEEIEMKAYHNDQVKDIDFKSLRGKWVVLFFYPADFTFVCPTEMADMQNLYADFQKEGAEVISVSTDSVEVHKAWHDNSPAIKTITYPMAADRNQRISRAFGVLIEDVGNTHRGTFIISPDGVVKTVEIHDDAIGRKASETLRKLKAAKYVSENPGNVCPASWDEGGDTLQPGLDLVGKI